MKKHRGLYGQSEGNETNPNSFSEHCADNDVVEGQDVATMKSMVKGKRWDALTEYVVKLRAQGWSQKRIDAAISRAGCGVRLS